ncbi:bifunctional ADP-dependent NAD(P)H-hydrate dehydratase/NAD(P)H-hydrate epimerase [Corynebacterium uterequi]|uniref:ADP-dependent (S)-NAD(P)H-hydrate dehydratase n=1 Tax=Corynebacterium uterequi TaxID=1072256 RepID=A0A0G3HM18_9CORY|nr:bifunctional ADP-dependent NAD(P)H-hydrate dehydratase/NAD(P)H-hydrate epimerase [Corynebacterium uterequi]AKK12142.1 putative sugar kinase [Corynebacterium uterequi]
MLTSHAFTAPQICAAEAPLLKYQDFLDELMLSAASAVTSAARVMLDAADVAEPARERRRRILVLAGSGGNGGDALYAGSQLAHQGYEVLALLLGSSVHAPALDALRAAHGQVIDSAAEVGPLDLIIDGLVGLGASGTGLREDMVEAIYPLRRPDGAMVAPVLAVDVPSGVNPNTGRAVGSVVPATVTVSFGGFRLAHALSPHCGEVVIAEARTQEGALSERLLEKMVDDGILRSVWRAVAPTAYEWPRGFKRLSSILPPPAEPGPADDKYSGGVVGIAAGSPRYPGAAVLATTAAVRTTPSMVRYAGPQAQEVVRALPEVVVTDTVGEAGRVQAWVYGPGSGTTPADDLLTVLASDVPVLIDADGLSLAAAHPEVREAIRGRSAATVLTPHDGEFDRLARALGLARRDRVTDALALAGALDAAVVLKGRASVIAYDNTAMVVDAGSSWAATPGSGDVLAGVLGALMARAEATLGPSTSEHHPPYWCLVDGVVVHARAAWLSAQTRFGPAPTSASHIAEHLREALAWDGVVTRP